jgi:SAM-dependent methyltransferase
MRAEDFQPGEIDADLDLFFATGEALGYKCLPGHRILDFGCGIGTTVGTLLSRGVDAYGVDVREFWGADFASYWRDSGPPPKAVSDRLFITALDDYRLPFEDETFDFCISSQVFEHVTNHEQVFAEIRRVLKPGAISLHLFPGPLTPVEPHIFVPIIPLCRYDWWLSLWAMVGRNRPKWREAAKTNRRFLQTCSYPSRRVLRAFADGAGLEIGFLQRDYLEYSRARTARLFRKAKSIGLAAVAAPLLEMVCQRMMALRKRC